MDAPEVLSASVRTRYALPDHTPDLAAMRQWAANRLTGLTEDFLLDVQLICTELVSNAYEHADGPRALRVVQLSQNLVRVEVTDGSPGAVPKLGVSRLADSRGRGLILISNIARCWGTRETASGKTVWAELEA